MDPGTEAARHALAAERVRSARFVSVFRFVGISIAFAMNLIVPRVIPEARAFQSDVRFFACYWLVAAAIIWATRHSGLGARPVGLDVAFPGWRAYLDGRPAPAKLAPRDETLAVSPGFLTVDVPAGAHTVQIASR